MESISRREEILLGYNSITISNSQRRNSDDVDFSDVFGGPPRRASTQSGDSHSNGDNNEEGEEGSSSSSWWMKLREKPVFGEATTAVRRRYTSDDFFDDIFRGDQPSSSCSQSPRVSYLSAPGSRVMSPSRSLPPAPLFASPTKFSLPTRATTAEFTASTSMNQTSYNPPMSRFNQTAQNHGSFLPRHNSSESTSDRQLDGAVDQSSPHSNAKGSDFPIYATNFHFSIYKWGSKSVPLVVSLRKKSALSKATNLEHSSSEHAKVIDADMLFSENHNVYVSDAVLSTKTVRPSSPIKEYDQRNDSLKSPVTTEAKSKEDVTAPAESNPTVRPSDAVYRAREDARESRSDSKVHKSNHPPELPTQMNSNLRPLSSFLNNDSTGNERINAKSTGDKISRVKEKEKAASVEDVMSHKVNKSTVRKSSQSRRKDGSNNNEALGKVKDFVKIFNQESPSKASSHGLHKNHSKKWKEAKTIETDEEIRLSSAKLEENEATYVNWGEELTDTVEMEDGLSSESQQFTMNDIGYEAPNVEQPSVNASTADSLKDSAPINSTPSDDDVLSNEAIKGYETKVLQWSKGKEGNIRSLLSTLQYVLWPESGWKPVPLVDIIEANAVKRAYQKALLRLHPDKLQQKGAAAHQKLIAEKVFDILQEAWDEFNSLGSL